MNKLTIILIIILAIAGLIYCTKTEPENSTPIYTGIIAAYNRGLENGEKEVLQKIRKEIIITGQLSVDIPLGNGTVKNMVLIIKQ